MTQQQRKERFREVEIERKCMGHHFVPIQFVLRNFRFLFSYLIHENPLFGFNS